MCIVLRLVQGLKIKYICDWICKTRNNPTRAEIQMMARHESHTLALSKHTNDRATYNIARPVFTRIISVTL